MQKYKVKFRGKELEVEKLGNGKFKVPAISEFIKIGLGSIWFDDCRIPYESEVDKQNAQQLGESFGGKSFDTGRYNFNVDNSFIRNKDWKPEQGRFPANLIVSDDVLNDGEITKGFNRPNLINKKYDNKFEEHSYDEVTFTKEGMYDDSGSFSRYFSLNAWWQSKINKLPDSVKKTFPFLIVPKASSGEKNEGLAGFETINNPADRKEYKGTNANEFRPNGSKRNPVMTKNIHPTVKPIQLMSYLITLGSRENDIILDPFIGSGTTAIASRLLTRNFIGFELDKEYHKIAEARIKHHSRQQFIGKWF